MEKNMEAGCIRIMGKKMETTTMGLLCSPNSFNPSEGLNPDAEAVMGVR